MRGGEAGGSSSSCVWKKGVSFLFFLGGREGRKRLRVFFLCAMAFSSSSFACSLRLLIRKWLHLSPLCPRRQFEDGARLPREWREGEKAVQRRAQRVRKKKKKRSTSVEQQIDGSRSNQCFFSLHGGLNSATSSGKEEKAASPSRQHRPYLPREPRSGPSREGEQSRESRNARFFFFFFEFSASTSRRKNKRRRRRQKNRNRLDFDDVLQWRWTAAAAALPLLLLPQQHLLLPLGTTTSRPRADAAAMSAPRSPPKQQQRRERSGACAGDNGTQ